MYSFVRVYIVRMFIYRTYASMHSRLFSLQLSLSGIAKSVHVCVHIVTVCRIMLSRRERSDAHILYVAFITFPDEYSLEIPHHLHILAACTYRVFILRAY
jgi:hypothetical protein